MKASFLENGGRVSELIADFDWASTSLGPIEDWPQSLRTAISLILRSPVPIVTLWHEDGVMIYNDAYSEFAGARHPEVFGSKVREGWPEVAEFNDNVMRVCLAGGTLSYRDQQLTLFRRGRPLQVALDLDYSPVIGESGKPIGVMAIVVERTETVRTGRWLRNEQERLRQMFEQAPGFVAMLRGPDHVFDMANPAYLQVVGHRDILGKPVREAMPDLAGQGYFELLDRVFQSGEPYSGNSLSVNFQAVPGGAVETKFVDLVYQPVLDADGKVMGIFVQGNDVTDRVVAERTVQTAARQSRQILDGAIDYAILSLERDGRIASWNEGARRTFGWTEDEVVGRHWEMLFNEDDRQSGKPAEAMEAALALGSSGHERWHVRQSGERFWASGELSVLRDPSSRPSGFVKVLRDRTDAYLSDQALAEAESRLQRAQEVGGVGVFSLDLATNMLSVTPEFCNIFGIPTDEPVSAERIEKLVVETERSLASSLRTRRDGSSTLDVEYTIHREDDGELRVIARKGEFERDPSATPIRFVGVVQDITERREEQRRLRDSEARFRALAQAMPSLVWTARPNGDLDWFNDRVYQYSGLREGELDGTEWLGIVHPDDAAKVTEGWSDALRRGQPYQDEFRLKNRDGVFRWHMARALPMRDETGAVVRWIGTNSDIEDSRITRDKLEQQVAERTADRDRMWRLSTDIMLVADFSGRISAVNPAWSMLSWSPDELVGSSFLDLIHPEDLGATLAEVARLEGGATTLSFENRYRCRDGSYRLISWAAVPSDNLIQAVGRDVTEQREAEASLRQTETALQQAQKMEAIGNLTGGVAHDFNNLLQVISGNLYLLRNDMAGNEKAERRITNALAGVSKGSKLAAQLLAFGRRQALDPRVLHIGRLVTGIDDMLRRTLGEGIEIETVISGGLWNTSVDPAQIENALLNLAINARDAMEGFGKLTIEVGNAYIDDNYARLHSDAVAGQYVALSVTDTGSGIPAEIIEKVFDPFFSTKPEGRGTGLGLSMVYGFVKQTGGHVRIYSELGHGTTVRLYLPRSTEQEDLLIDRLDTPVEGGTETILVAEDDDGVRATVVELLQELGYHVLKAPDATAALTIVESGTAIDLLFTDVVMPGHLKSADLARKAKERLPALAVLFTSGYTENSIVHGGRLDPGVQLLSKPYTREELARKVRQVLGSQGAGAAAQAATAAPPVASADTLAQQSGHPSVPSRAKPLVLLVEDQPLIRMNTLDMLEELGYDFVEAGSGREALDVLARSGADVAMIDVGLPDMTGDVLAEKVLATRPDLPIIFATGEAHAPEISRPATYLGKPYGLDELQAALDTALTNGGGMTAGSPVQR